MFGMIGVMRAQPADGFEWVDTPHGAALRCRALEPFADHLFTTRAWRLGSATADDETAAGWGEVADALAVSRDALARVRQVHGASVLAVPQDAVPAGPLVEADILVTDHPSHALAIQTADCVPLLIADPRSGAVAAAHAGWRGLAARVPQAAVEAMARQFGSEPRDLIAAIGPSIGAERYEVGADVRDRFESAGFGRDLAARWFPRSTRADHWLFDGWRAASDQLETAGLRLDAIHVARLCTAEHADLFCSHRRDGKRAGRMAAAVRSLKA
jgi:polyphenol oxidase